jgi:hypothetical protein
MPLFERQSSRNLRLFFDTSQELSDLVDLHSKDNPYTAPQFLKACIREGSTAANAAVNLIPSLKHAWGKGDPPRAKATTEVLTMAMVSRLLSFLSIQEQQPREVIARNLTVVFADTSPTAIPTFLAMDAQFNRECELLLSDRLGVPQVERTLLRLRLLEACGQPLQTRLDALTLPVDSLRDLARQEPAHGLTLDADLDWEELQLLHQILCSTSDRALTAFATPHGSSSS